MLLVVFANSDTSTGCRLPRRSIVAASPTMPWAMLWQRRGSAGSVRPCRHQRRPGSGIHFLCVRSNAGMYFAFAKPSPKKANAYIHALICWKMLVLCKHVVATRICFLHVLVSNYASPLFSNPHNKSEIKQCRCCKPKHYNH